MMNVDQDTSTRTSSEDIKEARRQIVAHAGEQREQLAWLAKMLIQVDDGTLDDHHVNETRLQLVKLLASTIDGEQILLTVGDGEEA